MILPAVMRFFFIGIIAIGLVRLIIGPTAADRLVGLNLVASQVLAFLIVLALDQGSSLFLDVALVYAIFGFLGVFAVSRFFTGRREE